MMRILRILALLLLAGFVLAAAAGLYLRHRFPPEKIRVELESFLSGRLGQKVTIGRVELHPLKGFSLRELRVARILPGAELDWIRVKRLELGYRWKELFHRRLVIDRIQIESPELRLSPQLLEGPKSKEPGPAGPAPVSELPFEIHVQKVDLRRAALQFHLPGAGGRLHGVLSGLDLQLSGLQISSFQQSDWLRPGLQMTLRLQPGSLTGGWEKTGPAVPLSNRLQRIRFELAPASKVLLRTVGDSLLRTNSVTLQLTGKISLETKSLQLETGSRSLPLRIPAGTFGFQLEATARPRRLRFRLNGRWGDFFNLALSGKSEGGQGLTQFAGRSDSLTLNLTRAYARLVQENGLDSLFGLPEQLTGVFTLDTLEVAGSRDSAAVQTEIHAAARLEGGAIVSPNTGVRGAVLAVGGRAKMVGGTLSGGRAWVRAELDSAQARFKRKFQSLGRKWRLSGQLQFGQNGVPRDTYLEFSAHDLLHGTLSGAFELETQGVRTFRDLDMDHIRGMGDVSLTGVDLQSAGAEDISGRLSLSLALNTELGYAADVSADLGLERLSAIFDTTYGWELLPDVGVSVLGKIRSTPGLRSLKLDSLDVDLADLAHAQVSATLDLPEGRAAVELDSLVLYFAPLKKYLPYSLQEELQTALWRGRAAATAELFFAPDSAGGTGTQFRGELSLRNNTFDNPYWGVRVDSLWLTGAFGGVPEDFELDLAGNIKAFEVPATTPVLKHTTLQAALEVTDLSRVDILDFRLFQPGWQLHLNAGGSLGELSAGPFYDLHGAFRFSSREERPLLTALNYAGVIRGNFSAVSFPDRPDRLRLGALVHLDSLTLFLPGLGRVGDIRGDIPLDQIYSLETGYLVPQPDFAAQVIRRAHLFQVVEPYLPEEKHSGFLQAGTAVLGAYRLQNLRSRILYRRGVLYLPDLSADLYGGNVQLAVLVNLATGALRDISYEISGRLAEVNSALLPGVGEKRPAPFSFLLRFSGRGLHFAAGPQLNGTFEVTEISARTADYFLRSIDPLGTDKTVANVRFLLNHGYRPRHLALKVRHGYLYPSISLSQPWYWPVKIAGGKIALSRLPLKALLRLVSPADALSMRPTPD